MKKIRRRTRVVAAFPDGQSCLNVAATRLRHIAAGKWSSRNYMNVAPLYQEQRLIHGAVPSKRKFERSFTLPGTLDTSAAKETDRLMTSAWKGSALAHTYFGLNSVS